MAEALVTVTHRLKPHIKEALERLAEATGKPQNTLVNEALDQYLAQVQNALAKKEEK